jgi:hypothetical protein
VRRVGWALLLLAGCVTPDLALECDHHASSSNEGRWCAAHRDLVLRFVRATGDPDGRRSRLHWFRSIFFPAVEKASSEDVVAQLVASMEKETPTFVRIFQQEHLWAVRDTGELNPDRRLPLMLAGFRHAIVVLDRELVGGRQGER